MSIPSTYNRLRLAALDARALADGRTDDASTHAVRSYVDAVIARANRVALDAWPVRMAELAEAHEALPAHHLTYDISGYTVRTIGRRSICASRSGDAHATRYLDQAVAELAPQLAREAELAEAAYERYRLAVAQGVAVDPDGESSAPGGCSRE